MAVKWPAGSFPSFSTHTQRPRRNKPAAAHRPLSCSYILEDKAARGRESDKIMRCFCIIRYTERKRERERESIGPGRSARGVLAARAQCNEESERVRETCPWARTYFRARAPFPLPPSSVRESSSSPRSCPLALSLSLSLSRSEFLHRAREVFAGCSENESAPKKSALLAERCLFNGESRA